jgi:ABC-2 type transport system ATP-binding protein
VATPFIALESLSKSYGKREAVRGISLAIPRGEIIGLLGPNGAGKSTTIAMLTGLLTPSSGGILWQGRSIFTRMREWRRALGVVLEDLSLFEYLSVREHLHLTARLAGLDEQEAVRRAGELIEFLQLGGFGETLASEASQGTRKKLAFALGLVHAPRILLLDEALNGIDAVTVSRIKGLLRKLARQGVTIMISSHVLDSVETIIDRCVIVDEGRVALDTPMDAVRATGRSLEQVYTETILGAQEKVPVLSWLE